MKLKEQVVLLNEFDNRQGSNWGIIYVGDKEFLGNIASDHATVVSPDDVLLGMLGEIRDWIYDGKADELRSELITLLIEQHCISSASKKKT